MLRLLHLWIVPTNPKILCIFIHICRHIFMHQININLNQYFICQETPDTPPPPTPFTSHCTREGRGRNMWHMNCAFFTCTSCVFWKYSLTLFTVYFSTLFYASILFPREKHKHCFVDKRILMYYANIPQILLLCEFAHWCAKIHNFCWYANSHTSVRKKKLCLCGRASYIWGKNCKKCKRKFRGAGM